MKSRLSPILAAITATVTVASLRANDPPQQPHVAFTEGSGGTWNADWEGVDNRTYFTQRSLDLVNWQFLPVLEYGAGLKGVGFSNEGASKYFFRLVYIDADWVTSEQEARNADFDGDGIPNWFEVEVLGSNPLDRDSAGGDSDSDGLPDGWELYWFGSLAQGPQDINPHTGLTHLQSHAEGRNPNVAALTGDGTQVSLTVFTRFD